MYARGIQNAAYGIDALVIIGASDSSTAGTDICEFGKARIPPHLPDLIATIEATPVSVPAAIGKQALDGGLEVALCCHYRITTVDARLEPREVAP